MNAGAAAAVVARIALAAGFLSAVADRFGLWGPPGATNVAWGSFGNFLAYTAKLNSWLPSELMPALGWSVTIAELVAAVGLLTGIYLRASALLSFVLLAGFAVGMSVGAGVKTALDASVPAAAAAALLLAQSRARGRR